MKEKELTMQNREAVRGEHAAMSSRECDILELKSAFLTRRKETGMAEGEAGRQGEAGS